MNYSITTFYPADFTNLRSVLFHYEGKTISMTICGERKHAFWL